MQIKQPDGTAQMKIKCNQHACKNVHTRIDMLLRNAYAGLVLTIESRPETDQMLTGSRPEVGIVDTVIKLEKGWKMFLEAQRSRMFGRRIW